VSVAKAEEANNEFIVEFLEDYFAECDEHLTIVRRNLLALERFVDKPRIDRGILDELFRSFHSLKGLSGMVGLAEAEQLAHETESYLRALRDDDVVLRIEGLDTLVDGTKLMEQVIGQHRSRATISDITSVKARLTGIVSKQPVGPATSGEHPVNLAFLSETEIAKIGAATNRGHRIWSVEFVPSAALAGRGVNVNTLRARLQETGELIHAAPQVLESGGIAFEFLMATAADEAVFAAWREDGITFRPFDASSYAKAGEIEAGDTQGVITRSAMPSSFVRVDLARIDDLMRMVGEMVISRSHLDENLKRVENNLPAPEWRPLQETNLRLERQLRDLREGVMRVRMVPIGEVFERMRFVVRDMARQYQKNVKLEISGQHTEIDKLLVERMMDPILHLVRNAVSHGLESIGERAAKGKPAEGKLALRAFTEGEMVVIEIEDDGKGIDASDVATRARALGLIDPGAKLDPSMLLQLICEPGLSTREEADRASGRGIGMAVVKNTVLGLGGSFELDTEVGRGARFTIHLPFTLAIADALIVSVSGERFAVTQSSVAEVMEVESSAVKTFENNEIIPHRGGVLSLVRLARLFNLKETAGHSFQVFVIGKGASAVGIAVDRILGQREIVVRAINDPLIQVPGITGATELGDGRIVLIVDAAGLTRAARIPQ
jgi:two-component system chemotaxis sensor kinase CheA